MKDYKEPDLDSKLDLDDKDELIPSQETETFLQFRNRQELKSIIDSLDYLRVAYTSDKQDTLFEKLKSLSTLVTSGFYVEQFILKARGISTQCNDRIDVIIKSRQLWVQSLLTVILLLSISTTIWNNSTFIKNQFTNDLTNPVTPKLIQELIDKVSVLQGKIDNQDSGKQTLNITRATLIVQNLNFTNEVIYSSHLMRLPKSGLIPLCSGMGYEHFIFSFQDYFTESDDGYVNGGILISGLTWLNYCFNVTCECIEFKGMALLKYKQFYMLLQSNLI